MIEIFEFLQTTPGILVALFVGAVSWIIWAAFFYENPYWKTQGILVHRPGLSFFFQDPIDTQLNPSKKYGKNYGTYNVGQHQLVCIEPEVIREVVNKEFNNFNNRGNTFINEPIFNEMLSATTDFEKWKRIRSVMSPTFSTGKLRRMRLLVEECTKIMMKNIERLKNKNNEVDLKVVFGAFAMEVVTQVAFGTKVDTLIEKDNPLIAHVSRFFVFSKNPWTFIRLMIIFQFPKLGKLLKLTVFDQEAMKFTRKLTIQLVEERKKNQDPKRKRCDFLQLMLDAIDDKLDKEDEQEDDKLQYYSQDGEDYHKITTHNKTLSSDELLAQSILFFFAGYETTSATVSYAVHCLAVDQEAQRKLYEEVKTTFDKEKEITYDVIMSLKYLDAVICETLRLYPTGGAILRVAEKDYTLSNGIKLPKGYGFNVPLVALHRDPDNFPEPDSFKPERFFPENRNYHPYAYLPFGAGPRNCIGMRLALMDVKLALYHFVLNYQFFLPPNSSKVPKTRSGAIISPKEMVLRVEKRT